MSGADRYIVEQAEAHGPIALRVMAWWAYRAKRRIERVAKDQVHGCDGSARRMSGGLRRRRSDDRIRVEARTFDEVRRLFDQVDVRRSVYAKKLIARSLRSVLVNQEIVEAGLHESILDGRQAALTFGVVLPRVVIVAGSVTQVDGWQRGIPVLWEGLSTV
jgi:hypothetical protein